MSTDIKFSNDQMSKTIQSGESFGSWLVKLEKQALINVAIYLTRYNLPGLVSNLDSNTLKIFDRNISGKGAARAEKRSTLFISNEDLNDIIKITKSLEDSNDLIDGITETVKHIIKNRKEDFFLLY